MSNECDLGQQSILHAVKIKSKPKLQELDGSVIEENEEQSGKPLCETLKDAMFSSEDNTTNDDSGIELNESGK
ncbi:hypothetical protein NQ314_012548 [Rhamnusium bicolor]|uniref:Uncharacterized protein n=1 Tax=Rhamnusium bicolor TaxID=1586634 RepID=A0AAV8XAE0_9CUCU|nr:hypothetical protein NQ314_012548 [Rhamnusium bicolor]